MNGYVTSRKAALLAALGLTGVLLGAPAAGAVGDARLAHLERKGQAIEHHLERRGERVERRLAHRDERAGQRLDRRSDRIEHRQDRRRAADIHAATARSRS